MILPNNLNPVTAFITGLASTLTLNLRHFSHHKPTTQGLNLDPLIVKEERSPIKAYSLLHF